MSVFDPTQLASLSRLALLARQIVEGFLSGVHKSPYKGFSVEFAEHRQYYPGDEIRHIDWRAFGKTDRYFIKEYEEETNLQAWLLLDASGSMKYAGKGPSKFEYAARLAASLSYLMLHQLDSVGLWIHDHDVRQTLPPHAHSKHWLRLVRLLEETQPGGETALAPLWHRLVGQMKRRGMIVVLSDCFDRLDELLLALRHFRHKGHEVLLMHVLAPEEIEFPFTRRTEFRSLENAGKELIDPQQMREEYRRYFDAFCRELRTQASDMRIDYHLLRTDAPVEQALGYYLAARMSRR
jgi:uncharacterized protein (DUF58 family)